VIEQRATDWISTFSGKPFWPLQPRVEDVRLEDIAHALSMLCRFAGHTRKFYSVAQHSVIVSHAVQTMVASERGERGTWAESVELALVGLLHDASEAYLCDITRPVKRSPELDGYRTVEHVVQHTVYRRFGLTGDEPAIVKAADTAVLRAEQRDLMVMPEGWRPKETAWPHRIVALLPGDAERQFLARFGELMAARVGA